MTEVSRYNPDKGICERSVRNDAVRWRGRNYVPTSKRTIWVSNWEEFRTFGSLQILQSHPRRLQGPLSPSNGRTKDSWRFPHDGQ